MRLDRFVQSRLSRSARTVRYMLAERKILLNGVATEDGLQQITKFCYVEAEGRLLRACEPVYVMMHKPRGCVSATRDNKNTTVLSLMDLPAKEHLHLAGRLDFNTTGLLLLTNDGNWSSQIMCPQQKIPKTYWLQTSEEITPDYVKKFAEGIYFGFENLTTLPAQLKILSATTAELTIYEGRYHQIKRMFGFFRNRVISLHRLSVGDIVLDSALAAGEYRYLTAVEVASHQFNVPHSSKTALVATPNVPVVACDSRAHSSVG
jgi:16S rRNA pseudouridine516 synthase